MKLVLTPDALADLHRIAEHVAQDSPARAVSFVGELREVARRIGDLPQGLPAGATLRMAWHPPALVRRYEVLYQIEPKRVIVLRFLGPGQGAVIGVRRCQ